MALMSGKRGLIMGVANERSIAWGIAQACRNEGANLAFTYQGEALKKRVGPLSEEVGSNIIVECDVSDPESIKKAFLEIKNNWDSLDFLVHAIGFSDKNELRGRYVDTTKDNFLTTMDISVYSFTAVTQEAEKLMNNGRSFNINWITSTDNIFQGDFTTFITIQWTNYIESMSTITNSWNKNFF